MRCPNCGYEAGEARFCPSCGQPLAQSPRVQPMATGIQRILDAAAARPQPGDLEAEAPVPGPSIAENVRMLASMIFRKRPPVHRPRSNVVYARPPSQGTADVTYAVLLAIMLLAVLGLYYMGLSMQIRVGNLGAMFLTAMVLAAIPIAAYMAWIYLSDRFEPEPPKLVFLAFAGGAVLSIIPAEINTAVGLQFGQVAAVVISAPIFEEIFKSLIVVWLAFRSRFSSEFNNHMDGFVYGAAAGLGFAFMENILYIIRGGLLQMSYGATIDIFVIRSLSAIMHAFTTGIIGWWIGYLKVHGIRGSPAMLAPAYLVAMAVHGVWNGMSVLFGLMKAPTAGIIVNTFMFIVMAYLIRKVMSEALYDEHIWGYSRGAAPR